MKGQRTGVLGRSFIFYIGICLFNLILGAYMWFPRFEWIWIFVPLPESTAAVLGIIMVSRLFRNPGKNQSSSIIPVSVLLLYTVLFVLLGVYTAAEAFFQHIYQRTFILESNLPLASHFFNMLFRTELFTRRFFLVFPAVTLLLLLVVLFYLLFRLAVRSFGRTRFAPEYLGLLAILVLSILFLPVPTAAERLGMQLWSAGQDGGIESVPTIDSSVSYAAYLDSSEDQFAFPGIGDRNIHLAVVESYGMTVYTNEHHFGRLEEFYRQQERLFEEAGYSVYSFGYESTTYGGTSWLADATILTGLDIHTQAIYDRIVKSGTPNLLHLLEDRGYTTILSAPGSKFMTPEYTGFYSYSHYFLYDDFEYIGPFFTFGRLPDQYQLFYIYSQIRNGGEPVYSDPYFVEYILCSSHVPWNFIPPYIESWKGFNNGRIYFDQSKNTWYHNSWAAGSELFEGYAHSIRYSLESVFGYARTYLDEDDILIVIGDHQPKYPVSEREATFGVPVHVIAKERGVILPFIRFGYREGLLVPVDIELPGLERFLGHFLDIAEGRFFQTRSRAAPLQIPR